MILISNTFRFLHAFDADTDPRNYLLWLHTPEKSPYSFNVAACSTLHWRSNMSRLLKITPKFQYSRSSTTASRGYNEESGLCYSEVTCNGGSMTADWTWKTTGRLKKYEKHRSRGPGCSSLRNIAIRVAMLNSLSITPETLAEVPWEVARQLWHNIIISYVKLLLL